MEHLQQGIEEPECCLVCLLVYRLLVCRLDHLKVPAGEFVPEEAVNGHQSLRDAVLRELVVQFFVGNAEHRLEPLHSNLVCLGLLDIGRLPSFHESESVPNLVVEVTSLLAKTLVEENVITCRSRQHHTHANAVGAVFVYQFYRVGRVAETLRHLAAKLVAHDACEVNVLERELAHVFLACHNHAGNPEEDDVGTCYEVACGIVVLYLFVVGVVDAVEERDRPQPRAEPCVECILVLVEVRQLQVVVATFFACQFESLFRCLSHYEVLFIGLCALSLVSVLCAVVVCRNAVSPPELARYAPVLYVLEPVLVGVHILSGVEVHLSIQHGR